MPQPQSGQLPAPGPDPEKDFRSSLLWGAVLVVATLLVYTPAFNGKFLWDDDSWTTGIQSLLRDFSGLKRIWCDVVSLQQYYPLTGTSFWLDYHLWGFWTVPYHIENVLLHALGALLFWRLLARLGLPAAWPAAAIFALHPLMVESVAWITERKNVFSLPFYLGALLAYGRFSESWGDASETAHTQADTRARRTIAYASAFLLFLAALLAKTTAVSLPVVLLLLPWWKTGRIRWRQDIVPSLPFFALALGFGLATSWVEKSHVGAAGPEWAISVPGRFLVAGRALWFYAGKLVWPVNECFVYPKWRLDAASVFQWLFPIAAVTTLLLLWLLRNRIGRGPIVAAAFYVVAIFPVLGFFNVFFMRYSFVSDHWAYLPSLGLIALGAASLVRIAVLLRSPPVRRGLGVAALSVLALLTWKQTAVYADSETLWRATIQRNPQATMAYLSLGSLLLQQGRLMEAEAQFRRAVETQPDSVDALSNLGSALFEQGRGPEAIVQFEAALKIRPEAFHARNNLANALARAGRLAEAIVQYQQAVEIAPGLETLRLNLGATLMQAGCAKEACVQFQRAVEIQPANAAAHLGLGNALLADHRLDEAIASLRSSVELDNRSAPAFNTLGIALLQKGRPAEAAVQFERALAIQPGFVPALHNLGDVYLQQGRWEEARSCYQKVLKAEPNLVSAHNNLGNTFAKLGKVDEAIPEFEKALVNSPDLAEAHNNLANALFQKRRPADAVAHYQAAVSAHPNDPRLLNNLAWALATCPESSVRDGARAVEVAKAASRFSGGNNPIIMNTLAAAYAEAGKFPEAVTTAEQALQLAIDQSTTSQADMLRARLALYKAHTPFRDNDLMPPGN